ncbi:sodium:solute symporter [Psychromonas sp. 14N.309.X.WAT.B.A12]|uniref:sodium:solute symporter family protein n=1 Tax=unclassified Psychromonas TaxID=2614957 RepID=UPI0025AEFD1B|nr:sodium:solute symporter family protein [Psychromonas sp. 14N.309.X.WAT.B.A12]MDN2663611.1 sodium:solute symporter family protein [Psychromonas sp. 14N.309.X.WAT.B.A12]
MNNSITIVLLGIFIGAFLLISFLAKQSDKGTGAGSSEDFVIGGRNTGTIVLLLSMGATYFSTWTLLGSFGAYFREGIWFIGFAVWTIFHGIFIWLFGARIWLAGKRYSFITPGQMVEHYYQGKRLRTTVALIGILALVPVMLIQVSGGALALDTMTNGAVPYVVGVTITSLMVGIIVLWAGFKGTAWTDSFMGLFFATILICTALYIAYLAGGFSMFENVMSYKPELMVNSGKPLKMIEIWLGLGFGAWVLPHMWQKFYSASSPAVLGKVAMMTPFWNSWMMAIIPLVIGTAAAIPGIVPGVSKETSDTILPLIFAEYAPILGAFVVAGILAAAISTINSQLLSSASIVAEDVVGSLRKKPMSSKGVTKLTRFVVGTLTLLVLALALAPGGAGLIVPIASLGFGLGLQLVPSALGMLHFRFITESGAFYGLISGAFIMALIAIIKPDIPLGPGLSAFIVNVLVTLIVSKFSQSVSKRSISGYHDMFDEYMKNNIDENKRSIASK